MFCVLTVKPVCAGHSSNTSMAFMSSASLIPPPPINTQQPGVITSLLYSGSKFRGYQKSKGNSYDVEVVLQVTLIFPLGNGFPLRCFARIAYARAHTDIMECHVCSALSTNQTKFDSRENHEPASCWCQILICVALPLWVTSL